MVHSNSHNASSKFRGLKPLALLSVLGFAFALVSGCGDDDDSAGKVCNPGDTRECLGPGACKGGQECLPNGSGFESCACGQGGPGGAGNDHTAGGDANNGTSGKTGGGGTQSGGGTQGGKAGHDAGGASGMATNGGEPSSAGASGSGGDGGAGGEGNTPVVAVCQPVGEVGCNANQNCEILADRTECVTAGVKVALAACTATSQCAQGLTCLPGFGVCAIACADDDGCGGGVGSCRLIADDSDLGIGSIGGCLKSCDVITQACPAKQACHLGSCMSLGDNLASGKACDEASQCAKGLDCLTDLDGDTQNDCSAYCSTTVKNPCPQGQECYGLDQVFPGVPATWGLCVTTQ